ncbi:flagellar motor switch protein FliN [Nocardioides marmoriginsengisoli]|uniref:Flagellar motor switch protein FliN n=1 Tax=Nocardioides marmoriginsengisoli TaxID=661483 RepID=A0A3N0CI57_9ACTN|nr:flagellar motor switch protein FliN [Nocardioides marmoriginsengisoli]RNL62643.1 flagellar motor switch protein FliN [Nocardioides marmoriginsengisoli]
MTTSPFAEQNPGLTGADLALAAASAAAAVLPSVDPLVAAGAQPGNEHVVASFSGAAITELDGARTGRIAVLVGDELTGALASSPIDGLDLAAATQPALDAIAATLGASARAAQTVSLDLVLSDLGPDFTVVPLIGAGIAASVLIQDRLLVAAATNAAPEAPFAETLPPAPSAPAPNTPTPSTPAVAPVETPAANVTPLPTRGIEMLHGVDMEVTVELGRTRMTVRDLLALTPGAVLELDRAAGSPADLLVNGRLIARGEVVVVDEDFGLRLTEIIDDSAAG